MPGRRAGPTDERQDPSGLPRDRAWQPPAPPVPLGPISASPDEFEWMDARLRSASAELERSGERAHKLHQVTEALLGSLTPTQVAETAVKEGAATVGASGGVLLSLAADGRIEAPGAVNCPPALLAWLRGRSVRDTGPFIEPMRSGQPAWLASLASLGMSDVQPAAWALLPLSVRDRMLGLLALRFEGQTAVAAEIRWFLVLLAQQCAQALERARLYDMERSARVAAQFAERQLGFLAAVSTRLARTLDEQESLAAAAELAVANLADLCAIHVLDSELKPRLAVAYWNEEGVPRAVPHSHAGAIDLGPETGYQRVIRTGEPELVPILGDAMLAGTTADAAHLEQLRALQLSSLLCVPILVREAIVGTITMASTESHRRFNEADVVIAEELASRVGQAIENARLYESTLAASRAKSNFLAVMSHELRTPLNAILGYADLVLLDVPASIPPETKGQVERIRAAAKHLVRIVDDVLSFTRAEAGQDRLRIEPVSLAAAISDALALVNPAATAKGLNIHVHADPDAVVHTDAGRLGQILSNLLTNAVKFTAHGGLEIEASLAGDVGLIRVRDTGIGISSDHHARIFDPFWQAEQGHTRRFGGTGIGLGVARHLARVLGGSIAVESELGAGSTFTLRIPARPMEDGSRERAAD